MGRRLPDEYSRATGPDAAARTVNWEVLALTRFLLAWIVVSVHTFMPSHVASVFVTLGGKAAVIGFMLISGFSIAASIRDRPQGFMVRRVLRIYPMYLGAILFTLVVQAMLGPHVELAGSQLHASGWGRVVGNLFLTQMYLCKALDFNGPFWTLSLEFSYYLLAPLFLLLPRSLLYLAIAASGAVFVLPTHPDFGHLYDLLSRFNGLRYLWSWLIGFCLYANRHWMLSIAALVFSLGVFPFGARDYEGYVPMLTIAFTFVVLHFSSSITVAAAVGRVFYFLGDLSYPLYLVHFPLAVLLVAGLHVQSDVLYFALSLALAWLNILVFDTYLKRVFFRPAISKLLASPFWK